jgi:RNA polymerase sigma-70 factor (ECF subfamily)
LSTSSESDSTSPLDGETEPITTPASAIHPDVLLLIRIRLGEESAMRSLYDNHSTIVYSVAFRVLRETGAAEDVLQDVFLRIWRRPPNFVTARGSVRGWLVIIARNRAIDVLRKRRPTDWIEDVLLEAPDNVSAQAECKLMLERVRVLAKSLPQVQRESLELAFFEGLTYAEIAESTNVPLGTVKTRIRTALRSLRDTLRR